MKKLPVIETFIDALKFPYVSFFPLLRRTGISLAILIGLSVALSIFVPAPDPLTATTEEMQAHAMLSFLVSFPVFMLGYAILINGSIQVINKHPLGESLFTIGSRELRFFLYFPLIFVVVLVLAVLTFASSYVFDSAGQILVVFAMFGLYYWINIRLSPLLGFIAIDNKFAVRDAWAASRGNALRILAIWLLLLLFCFVLLIPLAALAYAFLLSDVQVLLESADAGMDMGTLSAELSRSSSILNLVFLPVWLYLFFASFGAIGLIYKNLTDGPIGEENTRDEDQTVQP